MVERSLDQIAKGFTDSYDLTRGVRILDMILNSISYDTPEAEALIAIELPLFFNGTFHKEVYKKLILIQDRLSNSEKYSSYAQRYSARMSEIKQRYNL